MDLEKNSGANENKLVFLLLLLLIRLASSIIQAWDEKNLIPPCKIRHQRLSSGIPVFRNFLFPILNSETFLITFFERFEAYSQLNSLKSFRPRNIFDAK